MQRSASRRLDGDAIWSGMLDLRQRDRQHTIPYSFWLCSIMHNSAFVLELRQRSVSALSNIVVLQNPRCSLLGRWYTQQVTHRSTKQKGTSFTCPVPRANTTDIDG